MNSIKMALNDEDFVADLTAIGRTVNLGRSFPHRPFASGGIVHLVEYDYALSDHFGDVLKFLTERYGDETITFAATDPDKNNYLPSGVAPAFTVSADALPLDYGEGLVWEPGGQFATALIDTVNRFGIVGSSHTWAVWAQRDWEIGAIHSPDPDMVWPPQVGPIFDHDFDINLIRLPPPWGMNITPKMLRDLRRNLA